MDSKLQYHLKSWNAWKLTRDQTEFIDEFEAQSIDVTTFIDYLEQGQGQAKTYKSQLYIHKIQMKYAVEGHMYSSLHSNNLSFELFYGLK